MNILKNKKILIGGIVVIAIIIIVIVSVGGKKQGETVSQSSDQQSTAQGSTSTQTQQTVKKTTTTQTQQTSSSIKKLGIAMVSPASGDVWLLGKSHEIRWTHEGGHNGSIILLNASTKEIVGWITPTLSAQQVTYNWDTAKIALSRTNPSTKDITAGTYIIRVAFDYQGLFMDSAPFQIISSGTEVSLNHDVSIGNGFFSPNLITIPRGNNIVIINDNNYNSYTLKLGGVILIKLAPRDSYFFQSAQSGKYEFGIAENAIPRLTVTVQ